MTFPTWAFYGLGAAFVAALMPLVQERFRINAFSLAYGVKLFVVIFSLPLMIRQGLPQEGWFYLGLAGTSLIWCISDIIYFQTVATVGAGAVSRLNAGMTVPGFLVWLAVNPSLIAAYGQRPWQSAGILACILAAAFFATHLSRCPVTRQTIKLMWFTALAVVVGPTLEKLILSSGSPLQTPFALPFIEGVMMLSYWTIYALWRQYRQPAALSSGSTHRLSYIWQTLGQRPALIAICLIGLLGYARLILENMGMVRVEHPSYITVLIYTNVLWIILIYRLTGRKEAANVAAGLGLAASAAALVVLKSL